MPLPPDGTVVTAKTYTSLEYDRPAVNVKGKLRTRKVGALKYVQCWIGDVQVDPDTVSESAKEEVQLVEKEITVHRGGKTFTERRMVHVEEAKKHDAKTAEEHNSSLSHEEKAAVADWAGHGEGTVAGAYEMRKRIASGQHTAADKAFLSALENAPKHEGQVYRGMAWTPELAKALDDAGEGGVWEDAAPASHTRSPKIATMFSTMGEHKMEDAAFFVVHSKTARSIEHVDGAHLAEYAKEVVSTPGTKYRIAKIQKNVDVDGTPHKLYVHLEEL